jgi:hypothetical protein
MRSIRPFLITVLVLASPGAALAQVEIEVDPIAYAFNGFSLHGAKVLGAFRVNVGTFGIDVPVAIHGNDGWHSTMRGAGVKVDYLGSRLDGLFVGVEGGYMRNRYVLEATGGSEQRSEIGGGVRGGYRYSVGSRGLYVAPWVGVSYSMNGAEVAIGEATFRRSPVTVFPTVHIGWRF